MSAEGMLADGLVAAAQAAAGLVAAPQDLAAESVTSSIVWPWVVPVVVAVVVVVGVVAWYLTHRPHPVKDEEAVWVANSGYVEHIPQMTSWVRRYRALQWAGVGAVLVAAVAAGFLAARPVDITTSQGKLATRDIVLCLDVSGSMIEYDQQVVDVFSELVDSFEGERIALSIFNSTSRTVFPLTDDYTLVREQLEEAKAALDPRLLESDDMELVDRYLRLTAGTLGSMEGSSLIGDGLANCSLQFDQEDSERSRSIILATDNDLLGTPIYTLQQAVDLANSRDVTVNGLYGAAEGESADSPRAKEYGEALEGAGGMYFFSDDPRAVEAMVADVQSQQAVDLDAAPEISQADKAGPWLWVALVGVTLLVLVQWRLRE
ncbi:VWA domain-containing protein [Sanguibacter inulinus]|uniref:VWA domain-containing protein n=1 Tax=Sanguibacter inulinus TaxID=60922 RepID=A0A853EX40_9MICO|nr:VWA domain-containing protein [Sanguibacter inulinus]NYS95099.1 VWA domain-containing protein [Sanguibacter inulinus]